MKRILLIGTLTTAACAHMGMTVNRDQLKTTASFDHNCPLEQIQIVSEQDNGMAGTGSYVLNVCGSEHKYKRAGTMYYDAAKGSPLG